MERAEAEAEARLAAEQAKAAAYPFTPKWKLGPSMDAQLSFVEQHSGKFRVNRLAPSPTNSRDGEEGEEGEVGRLQ